MDEKILALASDILALSPEEARKNCKIVHEAAAYYFWQPVRGGNSVMINTNGEKLAATSAVSFEKHLEAFLSGKRN